MQKDIIVKKTRRAAKSPLPDQKKITVRAKGRPPRSRSAMVCEVPYDNNYTIDSILELSDKTCKWPIGHPDEDNFHFCGCPVDKSGGPYCSYHMALAYTQQPSSRSERTIQILENADKITVNNNIVRKDEPANEGYVYSS